MPNIATVLKSEIARLARKEVRAEIEGLKKSLASHRSEIAALKARVVALEKAQRRAAKAEGPAKAAPADDDAASAIRFSAKGLAAQRKRLGLSVEDCARLLGASGMSIYKWEAGKAKPRASFLPAIGELRRMGKKGVAARLQDLPPRNTP